MPHTSEWNGVDGYGERCACFLDSVDIGLLVLFLAALLVLGAFFALMETALMESHRGRLEKMAEDGNGEAENALELLERREQILPLAQVGITLTSILLGLCSGAFLAPLAEPLLAPLPHA